MRNNTQKGQNIIALTVVALFLFLSPSFARADITTGLQGYWALDEGSGTSATDSSGNGHTGTITGSPAWVAGKSSSYALNFATGTSPTVDLGSMSVVRNASALTISAWVKFDVLNGGDEIVMHNQVSSTNLDYYLKRYRGTAVCSIRTSATVSATANFTNNTGVWHLLTCTYDGANVVMYYDGVSKATSTQTGNTYLASGNAKILSTENTIDDVRIYSRALSAADVLELYNYTGADIYPPNVSNISATAASTTAIVTWVTDESADSQLNYGLIRTHLTENAVEIS